mgnify:CR=1 FL=1
MGRLDDAKKQAKETAVIVEDALRGIAGQISSIFEEALDTSSSTAQSSAKEVQKIFNNLAKVGNMFAEANQKAADGAFKLSDKLKIVQQRQARIFALEQQIEIARRNGASNVDDLNKELDKVKETEEEVTKELDAQLALSQKINKQMGLTGATLGLLKTAAGKLGLGNIGDAFESANAAALAVAKESEGLGGKFKVLGAALGSLGKSFIGFLTDPLAIIGLLGKGLVALVKVSEKFAKKTSDVGKAFLGLSGNVKNVKNDLATMATDDTFLNFEEAFQAMKSLNAATGTQVMLSKDQVQTFQRYTEMLGMSEENAGQLFRMAQLSDTAFSDMDNTIGGVVKGLNMGGDASVSLNDVIDDVANASAQTAFNLNNNPDALAKAAFNAKRLGMTMEQISAASSATLDFESSIQNEMEAELLLGKNLNLEQLRYAALTGDVDTQAKELNRILADNIDQTEGNVIKQEALAKSLGMSVEDMFKANQARIIQNKLGKLGAKQSEVAQKKLNQLISEGKSEKEALAILAEEDLNKTVKATEASQRLARIGEQIKENFFTALDKSGALDKIQGAIKSFEKGGGMETLANTFAKAGNVLGGIITSIAENPGGTIKKLGVGLAVALGAKMLLMKRIPQVVTFAGGVMSKLFGKSGSTGSKALSKASAKGLSSKQIAAGFGGKEAKDQLAKQGGKIGGKNIGKIGAKLGAKTIGKSLLKKIPGVGLLFGVGYSLQRAMKGDYAGAALELASGAASLLPGAGTMASVAIDAGLAAKDIKAATGGGGMAADFISRPGQPIQKFRKDDIIVGGTSLGGGNNGEVVALLKELISEVRKGGDVFMDGTKVGKSLILATSKMG